MKKFLTIMATTVLGTTAIANSNLISQIQLNNQLKKISNGNVKDNTNPFFKQGSGFGNYSQILSETVAPNGTVYVIGNDESGSDNTKIFYSTDGINFQEAKGYNQTMYEWSIVAAPNGNIYALGVRFYVSTDGINFQEAKGYNQPYISVESIAFAPNGIVYARTTNDGLYYSTDGINFKQLINLEDVWFLTTAPDGTLYYGTDSGVYYSTDGKDFKKVNGINNNFFQNIAFGKNGTVYIGSGNSGTVYYSTDGINFKSIIVAADKYDSINQIITMPNGTIYVWTDFSGSFYSTDGINFKQLKDWEKDLKIVTIAPNGTVYAIADADLYYSTDNGNNFVKFKKISNSFSQFLTVAPNGTVYIGNDNGLFSFSIKNQLMLIDTAPNLNKQNNFIYSKDKKITVQFFNSALQSASLDGKSISLNNTITLSKKEKQSLVLTLKNQYKDYAALFNGDNNTGTITYNFWIKSNVKNSVFSVITDDTNLATGLISNAGDTNGSSIIQTSSAKGTGHADKLKISLQDKLVDLSKSYYVSGNVDKNNNFAGTGSKVYLNQSGLITNNHFIVSTDGIYQLHLVDKVGNTQDTYLELGQENWKLKGTFNGNYQQLAKNLNVTVSVSKNTDQTKANIQGFLNQYKQHADTNFSAEAKKYGAGFNITVADLPDSYKTFLDSTTYTDQGGTEKININELDNAIKEVVQKKINSGLNLVNSLTKKYNISTSNVIDSNSLNSYINWINNYDNWFNKNEAKISTNEINKISHGYASQSEIKNILANINISNIFNNVNYSLQTSTNYQQFINYQNLDQAILKTDSSQTWETQYQADLKIQESNLNLHGYTIAQILGNKQEPQTKSQMENYDNSGESFHTWLQTEANSKYHKYQLDTGLEIGLPLFVLVSLISLTWYYRNTKKYKLFVFKRTNIKNKEKVDD